MEAELKALVGGIAGALGKTQSELLSEIKDGDAFKKPAAIKSYIAEQFDTKFDGLVSSKKVEQARGRAQREAYKEIEDQISETFEIDGKLKDGLLDKVKEKVSKTQVVEKSEKWEDSKEYKDLQTKHKAEIKTLKTSHKKLLMQAADDRATDELRSVVVKHLRNEKNNYILPTKDTIFNNQVDHLVDKLKSYKQDDKPVKYNFEKGKGLTVTDADDFALVDAKHNEINLNGLIGQVATNGYFAVKEASGRETASTEAGDKTTKTTETREIKFGDNKSVKVPVFEDKKAMQTFLASDEAMSLDPHARNAIREEHADAFNKPD